MIIKKRAQLIIAVLISLLFVPGCTSQETQTATRMARVAVSAKQLIQTWDTNKFVLQKYHDKLQFTDPDRLTISQLIETGNTLAAELQQLGKTTQVPSIPTIKILFTEAELAVQIGQGLYIKYEPDISSIDKFRAKRFLDIWTDLQEDFNALTSQTSNSNRYQIANNILSFALLITGQIIIPSLQAAGKI